MSWTETILSSLNYCMNSWTVVYTYVCPANQISNIKFSAILQIILFCNGHSRISRKLICKPRFKFWYAFPLWTINLQRKFQKNSPTENKDIVNLLWNWTITVQTIKCHSCHGRTRQTLFLSVHELTVHSLSFPGNYHYSLFSWKLS